MTEILKKKYIIFFAMVLQLFILLVMQYHWYQSLYIKILFLIFFGIPFLLAGLKRPWIFIYILLLTVFVGFTVTVFGIKLNATHGLIVLISLYVALYLMLNNRDFLKESLFIKPLLVLLFCAVLSLLFAMLRGIDSPWVIRGTFEVFLLVLLYQSCVLLFNDDKRILCLKFALIAAGTIVSLQTLYSYSFALQFSFEKMARAFYFIRGGTFGASPNQAAIFIELTFPLLLISYLYTKIRLWKISTLVLLLIMFLAIFSTFSRGAILGLVTSVIIVVVLTKKFRDVLMPAALLLFFLLISSFYLLLLARFQTITMQTVTLAGRIPLFKAAMNIIKDNWVIGIGMNNFQHLKYSFGFPFSYDPFEIQSAHNIYLEMFANLGIMGFIATVWIFVGAVIAFKRSHWRNEQRKINYIAFLASISTFYIHGIVDCAIANIRTMIVFVIIIALLAVEYRRNKLEDRF